MRLAELQRAFFARIAQVGEAEPGLEAEVRAQGALSPAERLDLYANMYFVRLLEALRHDFAAVAKLLGEEAFEEQVAGYVRARPSTHPSLGELGRGLEAHLRTRALPEAAELAALEWARAEVRVEADAVPAPREALAGIGPERFGEARLLLIPALRVLTPEHDVDALWRRLEQGVPGPSTGSGRAERESGPSGPLRPGSGRAGGVVVWRRGFDVFHASVSLEEAGALRLAQEGRPLAEVCAAFETAEEPARAAFAALASWLAEEMVAGVEA